ncbi:MAG: protein-glutamate O-methyltransferase CheR [Cytophagales bacterium]|nr:protein-glutamate O-methyltransferase CheR [Cytophagales bacterium]
MGIGPPNMINDEEVSSLMVAINNRYGLDFTNYEQTSLKRGIVRLMMKHRMESSIELWSKVLRDKHFFDNAIDDLLVNLTELFRNPDVWIKLRDDILPKNSDSSRKIWHAGCSTGEEVYTMSFVLEESGLLAKTKITATDLSTSALNKAIKGEYSTLLMTQYLVPFLKFFPNKDLKDYFDYKDAYATVKSKFQFNMSFRKHNLVIDPMNEKFDIILCRNVMIYFDQKLKIRVLDLLFDSLNEEGLLIIGYYDIMPDHGKMLFDIYDVKTRMYKKKAMTG